MQTGTVAAMAMPYRRQVEVSTDRTLSAQDLNGLILVDSTAGPVVITLPEASVIGAGGFFLIVALTGDVNPVTVSLTPGDAYNQGQVAPIVLDSPGDQLPVLGSNLPNRWTILLSSVGEQGTGEFDNRGSPLTTGVAADSGGVVDFVLNLQLDAPEGLFLRIVANANTVNSTFEFFRDSARADLLYQAAAVDAFTAPFVDNQPFPLFNTLDLENRILYGRITNDGANPSSYDVSLLARG